MYRKLPNLILGFHGCSKKVFDNVLHRGETLRKSDNSYDWLGNGIYFWEHSHERAMEWAVNRYGEGDGYVIGAVLDLGNCLNLTDYASSEVLRTGYELLRVRCETAGTEIPHNRISKKSRDVLLRDLDCAVIEQIHDYNKQADLLMYDSVRGVFEEGLEPYPGSAFKEKTHIQVCVRNPNCIKGYFAPILPNKKIRYHKYDI